MKKVLFLTPQLPYPPISGGVIKSHKLLSFMAEHYQLALCCLLKSQSDERNLASLQQTLPNVEMVSWSLNIARTPWNFIKSCLVALPLTIYRNHSMTFKRDVALIAAKYEVIFVDHYLMFQYVPDDYQGTVVVHQHNAEFVIWARMAEQTTQWLKKALLSFEAKRIRQYEVVMCNQADAVLAAPNDQQALIDAGAIQANFFDTYHLGDEQNLTLPELVFTETQPSLLFVGTLSWEANVDGLIWFLQDIWPQIKAQVTGVRFSIVGKYTTELKNRLLSVAADIDLIGFVGDLESVYRTHRVFVAPLRFGSGIKVKVVNGLYRGLPTVTTSVGAEGLTLNSGEHLFIVDQAQTYADAVVQLLNDQTLWQQFSQQSRQIMQTNYTWDKVFNQVNRSITGET